MAQQHDIQWQQGAAPSSVVEECSFFYENHDIEDIYKLWDDLVSPEELTVLERILKEVIGIINQDDSSGSYNSTVIPVLKSNHTLTRKAVLLHAYQTCVAEGRIERCHKLENWLITKKSKSSSGVLVITVLTSPYPTVDGVKQRFSCEWNCYYCPNQPGQPRSYLRDEPAVLRANQNGFDPVLQFTDRARVLAQNGHPVDKVELIVLGGTWSSYPHDYQEAFVRDLFYAANVFMCRQRRKKLSLREEQCLNETALCKIIGLTLETRPDTIDRDEIRRFRYYGCTRVQLGLQHTDDAILEKINRQCTNQDAKRAIKLLKESCFKLDCHIMLNLPGSSPQQDIELVQEMLSPDLQCDQWKLYPCEVTPFTVIKKWFDEGSYVPYSEEELVRVLIDAKSRVPPWIRLNRVVRDIPKQYIFAGIDTPNLRQDLVGVMKAQGLTCRCIRCREVGLKSCSRDDVVLKHREYLASDALEHFISFETPDETVIFGFIRLRVPKTKHSEGVDIFPELRDSTLIRELHVYGKLIPTELNDGKQHAQHIGLGRRLLERAEIISSAAGFSKITVIAGVGTREYYRKCGYCFVDEPGQFMMKILKPASLNRKLCVGVALLGLCCSSIVVLGLMRSRR